MCMTILLAKQGSANDECRDNDRIFGFLKIKSDIITGALKPGKKLKLDTLKVQYSASVSTLRETLNRLASNGFVVAPEQRGFLVRTMSNEDLIELSNLRVLLECATLKASLAFED